MNIFLYYLDKFTAWLDFSWLVTLPKKIEADEPPPYAVDPLLR
jgi:hypothetical protein